MVTYNLLHDWESQTRSFWFGTFEKMKRIETLGYALPGIAKFENHIVFSPVSFDGQVASFGHRLDRVLAKVKDDLLYFLRIEGDERQVLIKFNRNSNTRGLVILDIEGENLLNYLPYVARLEFCALWSCK